MSTASEHQQSLANAGSKTRPSMLERGSYIPWASRLKRYLNRMKETRKFLNRSINEGPYQFKIIQPDTNRDLRPKTDDDITSDALKQYEADIEAMNLILISIPNDIYNRVECLMETRFNNEFDQFISEHGESLVLVYNRFTQ
nr:hypothetical protein [Tanacetum cinerariifolium]